MRKNLFLVLANTMAIFLLVALIATPIYFAKNFAKVAGVKTQSEYLIVSQIEKFPNLKFSQVGQNLAITYTKSGTKQAYLETLILNNPQKTIKTYHLNKISGEGEIFFGSDLSNQSKEIVVPPSAAVPISLISSDSKESKEFLVNFSISVK